MWGWGLGEPRTRPLAEGLWGGVAVQGLLPLRPAPETMAWLHSISRHPRTAVSSVQCSPWLFALGVAMHEVPLLHPIKC